MSIKDDDMRALVALVSKYDGIGPYVITRMESASYFVDHDRPDDALLAAADRDRFMADATAVLRSMDIILRPDDELLSPTKISIARYDAPSMRVNVSAAMMQKIQAATESVGGWGFVEFARAQCDQWAFDVDLETAPGAARAALVEQGLGALLREFLVACGCKGPRFPRVCRMAVRDVQADVVKGALARMLMCRSLIDGAVKKAQAGRLTRSQVAALTDQASVLLELLRPRPEFSDSECGLRECNAGVQCGSVKKLKS